MHHLSLKLDVKEHKLQKQDYCTPFDEQRGIFRIKLCFGFLQSIQSQKLSCSIILLPNV